MKLLYVKYATNNKKANGGDIGNARNYQYLSNIVDKENIYDFVLPYYSNKLQTLFYTLLGFSGGVKFNTNRNIYNFAKKNCIDCIFIDSSIIGPISKKIYKKFFVIHFFHNVESLYYKQYFSSKKKYITKFLKVKTVKIIEKRACDYSSQIITLNLRDSNEIEMMYGRKADFQIPILFRDRFDIAKTNCICDIDLLFIGFDFYGNTEGLFWFIENCLDKINGSLIVIGGGMDKYSNRYKNKRVLFKGFVENLDEYLYKTKAVVLPIISGSGMKTKTCEALMFGKTIFGTQEAFEGYDGIETSGCYKCNSSAEFIISINNFLKTENSYFKPKIRQYFLDNFELDTHIQKDKTEFLRLINK